MKYNVTVLGAGNMGTALAKIIGENGWATKIWNYEGDPEPLDQINQFHENKKYLAGVSLSENIVAVKDLKEAVAGADVLFFVLPSNFMEGLVKRVAPFITKESICVDVSKGLEEKTLKIIPQVMMENLPKKLRPLVASISGPAVAVDMVRGFAAMNLSSKNIKSLKVVKKVLENKNMKLVATNDMVGVEVGGSLKNVYAVALGICDGLKMPMNTKAAILVSAIKEMGALVKKMGGRAETVFDLAGLGDLIGTGLSAASRNRRFGEALAVGLDRESAAKQVGQVVEGINASKLMKILSAKYRLQTPLAAAIYRAVWQGNAQEEIINFLQKIK